MNYIKLFLAVTFAIAAQITIASAQSSALPSDVQKSDEYSKLGDAWNDKCLSGNCVNGKGERGYRNGDRYEGDFVGGRKIGQGTYTFANGDYYIGQFKNDKWSGSGKYFVAAKTAFLEGIWANGLLVKSTTPIDKCVSGNCVNGKGKMVYATGDIYDGDFVNGKREGQGTQTKLLGSYTGQWKNDEYNGYGKLLQNFLVSDFGDDYTYEGNFVNGKREGRGTSTLKNGDLYTGEWKNDKQNGYGTEYIKATMAMREGTWKDGAFINTPGVTKITPVTPEAKFPIDGIATQLRETLNGKYYYMDKKPLTYIFVNKKTNEVLRYQIEFIEDGGKLAFRWKESTKKEQSEKLVITDAALSSATKYVNFFSTKTTIGADNEIAFILSQRLHKDVKDKKEINLDLGGGVKRLTFLIGFTASSGTYTDKNVKVLRYQDDDGVTKVQILDDPICPLIVKIETAEYTLTLV